MTVPANIIELAVAGLLLLIGSFCVGIALTPPDDADAEAKLFAAAVFFIGLAFILGVHS